MNPLVYIILVNYNGYHDTAECMSSLDRINYDNFRIIIIDNASCEKDRNLLKSDQALNRQAEIIYSAENGGFAEGNNIGIRYAVEHGADYVLLLNNDTVVDPGFLKKLMETAESHPETAIVTGRIRLFYSPEQDWYAGGNYNYRTGITEMLYYPECTTEAEVSFASGCLMLIRSEYIKMNGLLDTSFFMYSEDTDYCCRVHGVGRKIFYNSEAVIYHKVSASMGAKNNRQQYYLIRNNLYVIKRYVHRKWLAYMIRLSLSIKEAVAGYSDFATVFSAFHDFRKGITGEKDVR